MCLGQFKFFVALHLSLNDHESTVSIDLGAYKEILAGRQIYKYKIMNNDINAIIINLINCQLCYAAVCIFFICIKNLIFFYKRMLGLPWWRSG